MNPAVANILKINLNPYIAPSKYDNKTAELRTSDGELIRLFATKFREPLFKNGYIDGYRNSIEFQNTGNTSVNINGNWTILPGGSKKFDLGSVDINSERFHVYFPSDPFNGLQGNRVEVCEIIMCDIGAAFFREKGISVYE